jgi:hypothetical protein
MSAKDRERYVEMARRRGINDAEILKLICEGTGGDERRQIIVDWASALGKTATEALQLARFANLIPSTHPPRAAVVAPSPAASGTPLQTTQETSDE